MENAVETGKRVRKAVKNGGEAGRDEWKRLVADVEDLVKKVANVDDDEIAEIRSKVESTLAEAKSSAGAGVALVRGHDEDASEATDEYVRENTWAAIGIAAAGGIIIGFVAGRR